MSAPPGPQETAVKAAAKAAAEAPLLQIASLSIAFGDGREASAFAVRDLRLEVRRAETLALLGQSGSGKTIAALAVTRLLPPAARLAAGSVRFDGRELLALPERDMRLVRGRRIAMIFQEPQSSLNPVLSIGRQIGEVLRLHRGLRGRALRERTLELLDAVRIPEPRRRIAEYPHQLSGGMKQRAMIAIALAGEPELLIADEPTTALDVTIQAQILELLEELRRRTGMAVLFITHDLGVAAQVADRVAVMKDGHVVETAARDRFFAAPEHPYSRELFAALPARLGRRRPGDAPGAAEGAPQRPRSGDAGNGADRSPPAASSLLEVRDLKVHFPIRRGVFRRQVGHVAAVDGVSLTVPEGRTLALVGESGSGKTTLGRGVLQLARPTAGSVRFAGMELTQMRGAALRRLRAGLQVIFQDPYASMNPRMTIADIVDEGMRAQGIGGSYAARMARVDRLLEQVRLDPAHKYRYPHEFSGGQRQRICIARALAVGPRLLICDEPTSSLDVSVQSQILKLLLELQERLGLSYLFITHDLGVVEYLADEVAVMYRGRLVEHGPTERVLSRPQHSYTQRLLAAVPRVPGDD